MKRLFRAAPFLSFLLLLASAPATRPALMPVPSQTAQADALRLIQKLFKEDYQRNAPNDQVILSRTLIQESRNTHDNPAGKYVLLTEAIRLSVAAGDAELVVEAVTLLSAQFEVMPTALLVESLPKILDKPRSTNQLRALATQAILAIDMAVAREDFVSIEPFARAAELAVTKVRQVDFAAKVTQRVADAREMVAAWKAAQEASEQLKTRPNSAVDHLTLGRFYALRLGQFERGLPDLAAGADEKLSRLAKLDLAAPTDPMAQKSLADAWWDYATNNRDSGRALDRAKFWYARARDSLTGLTLRDIDSRLASTPTSQPAVVGVPAHTDAAIDLIPQNQSLLHPVEGDWALDRGVLTGTGKTARVQFPVIPPAEYDLEMTFSREGRGGVVLLLASGERNFNLMLDISGSARLEQVSKKTRADNPTLTALELENGKTYVVRTQIRQNAVYVLLDGKPLLAWRTGFQDLSRASQWKIPNPKCLGVGISSGTLRVEHLSLTPISGQPTTVTDTK